MRLKAIPSKARALAPLLAVLASLAARGPAHAAESLDPSFGRAGIALPGIGSSAVFTLAEDGRGRVVGGGTTIESFMLARFLRDGSLDPTFGDESGFLIQNLGDTARIRDVGFQPGGKILAAGAGSRGTFILTRYRPDGLPDNSFGKQGRAKRSTGPIGRLGGGARSLAFQSSGRVLAAGYGVNERDQWRGIVLGYHPDGTLDRSFGEKGLKDLNTRPGLALQLTAMAVLPDDRILLAGDFAGRVLLVRLRPNGDFDPSFGGGDGQLITDVDGSDKCRCAYATGMDLDGRGRIVVSANATGPNPEAQRAAIVRYLPNGKLDRSFGGDGIVRSLMGSRLGSEDVAVQKNGRIVMVGFYNVARTGEARVAAIRYMPNGRLDPSFGRSGYFRRDMGVESVACTVLVQRDGRVVLGGRRNLRDSPFEEGAASVYDEAEVVLMRFLP